MVEVLQEPFTLTQGDSDITATDGGTSASILYDIFSYHVPTGIGLILLPGHTFAAYLYDNETGEAPVINLVKLVVKDSSKQDERTIFGPALYKSIQNFTDRDQMARLNITAPVKVYEKQYLVLQATGDGTYYVDASACYFELAISRVRQPL